MFALEVEDVDRESTLIKVGLKLVIIIVKHRTNSAIIVMPDDSRKGCFGGERDTSKMSGILEHQQRHIWTKANTHPHTIGRL